MTTAQRSESSAREWACVVFLVLGIVAACAIPPLAQDATYHAFADQRTLLGIPRAIDVLSSLAFSAVGVVAVAALARARRVRFDRATEACLWAIAVALTATGIGSAAYHLDPRDATLVFDRLPMTLAFAGVLSLAIAARVSERAGVVALPTLALLGAASVAWWSASGNVMPYAVMQYGSVVALVVLVATTRRGDDPFPWGWLIACYVVAKLCEVGDALIHAATNGVVAGHALKHLAAAAGAAALFAPSWNQGRRRR